jgi:hypothetical protein
LGSFGRGVANTLHFLQGVLNSEQLFSHLLDAIDDLSKR